MTEYGKLVRDKIPQVIRAQGETPHIRVLEGPEFHDALERKLQEECRRLEKLRKREEEKRSQVVEARKETATIEKLKEHKLEDYRKAEQKDEEHRIEEFVSTTRAMAAMGI